MELDDQLAALAAGELDDDTARALRARAAADPAVARRLARHERLQTMLSGWEAPPLSADATARLDAAVAEALDALGDEPLVDRPAPTGPLTAVPAATTDDDPEPAAAATRDGVTDLSEARRRREERRTVPGWLPGASVAAALLLVVGVGVVGGGLFSSSDEATDDVFADSPTEESADEMAEDSAASGLAADSGAADDDMADDGAAAESMEESAALAPAARTAVEIQEGDLLSLLDEAAEPTAGEDEGSDAGGDAETDDGEAARDCVVEALERDTAEADGREVWLLATGRYAERDAVFVVIRSLDERAGDRYEVLAYDPSDCSLLARDETLR